MSKTYSSYDEGGINLVGRVNWWMMNLSCKGKSGGEYRADNVSHPSQNTYSGWDDTFSIFGVIKTTVQPSSSSAYDQKGAFKEEKILQSGIDWGTCMGSLMFTLADKDRDAKGNLIGIQGLPIMTDKEWDMKMKQTMVEYIENPLPIDLKPVDMRTYDNKITRDTSEIATGGYCKATNLMLNQIIHHYVIQIEK